MTEIPALPTERPTGCPFDPPAELRERPALSRLTYPDGHLGWLGTSRDVARTVLADPRFSIRYELQHLPMPNSAGAGPLPPAPPGDFTGMDAPEHTRYRRLLVGQFTVRRMRQLTERVEQVTAEHLDEMARIGWPADLVTAFAQPVPTMMICELLGVPYEEREQFQRNAVIVTSTSGTEAGQEFINAFTELQTYLSGLIVAKRAHPTDDLLSGLTESDLTDEELAMIGVLLLGAGVETTASMISLGAWTLLNNPDQLAALRADPSKTDAAIEELLRYLSIVPTTMRTALEDVEVAGTLISKGETVTLSLHQANRDPAYYPNPDTVDVARDAASQVAFSHGIHQCLGQQLARVELRVALPALINRFPNLRLAIPSDEIPLRGNALMPGVTSLPVAW
ncbi:MAG TPA: cytochrome P450 [Pseudonocardiaceae bacterium]|jgi:cytochrome P450|nr:cytochrome P450 [Pseudonocardiaceae bacterium]